MDSINPEYYKAAPFTSPKLECIDIARYLPFSLGNAFKYVWRAGSKGDLKQDLEKAKWYLADFMKYDAYMTNHCAKHAEIVMRDLVRDCQSITRRQRILSYIVLYPVYESSVPDLIDECQKHDVAFMDEPTELTQTDIAVFSNWQ